jgi:hypothetical protein
MGEVGILLVAFLYMGIPLAGIIWMGIRYEGQQRERQLRAALQALHVVGIARGRGGH